jgi:hypothetical protein
MSQLLDFLRGQSSVGVSTPPIIASSPIGGGASSSPTDLTSATGIFEPHDLEAARSAPPARADPPEPTMSYGTRVRDPPVTSSAVDPPRRVSLFDKDWKDFHEQRTEIRKQSVGDGAITQYVEATPTEKLDKLS